MISKHEHLRVRAAHYVALAFFCGILALSVRAYGKISIPTGGRPQPDPAITGSDDLMVAYYDSREDRLACARWVNGEWELSSPDSSTSAGNWASMAVDDLDSIYISYYDSGNHNLKFAYSDGAEWDATTVDQSEDVGEFTSIAVSSDSYPYISYYDASSGNLKMAVRIGLAWSIQVVDSAGDVGMWTSIALDGSGKPRISYYDVTNGDLKYAAWTGTAWSIETVSSSGDVGLYSSIALDRFDKPHISFYDGTNGDLRYARKQGSNWVIEAPDTSGDVGLWTSIAVDPDGKPRISYYDATNGDLKYAKKTRTWSLLTLESQGNTGLCSRIVLSSADVSNITCFDSTDCEIHFRELYEGPGTEGSTGANGIATQGTRRENSGLLTASPNPFGGETRITLTSSSTQPTRARVAVYDILGREVDLIWDGPILPGPLSVTWDGRDSEGGKMASGFYIVKATTWDGRGLRSANNMKILLVE
jgi:hypothetical protein